MAEQLRPIAPNDSYAQRELELLLAQEGLCRDSNLDYSCGLYDEEENLIATGSCFGSTIRCLAVSGSRRGEGLLIRIVSHLISVQAQRGNLHVFLYTKSENAPFFSDLGFHEIVRVDDRIVFMENQAGGFQRYCDRLETGWGGTAAGIVMNANPFTLGHRHLIQRASQENDTVHLFLLSEEAGPIPFSVRMMLVKEGIRDLPNVILHETGPYMISSATFPSYFLKEQDDVIRTHAALDLAIFSQIAGHLGIRCRYVGEETGSRVTMLYNEVMAAHLPQYGLECRILPRLRCGDRVISASTVRQAIHDDCLESVRSMLPESTYRYFSSEASAGVRDAIRRETDVIHY